MPNCSLKQIYASKANLVLFDNSNQSIYIPSSCQNIIDKIQEFADLAFVFWISGVFLILDLESAFTGHVNIQIPHIVVFSDTQDCGVRECSYRTEGSRWVELLPGLCVIRESAYVLHISRRDNITHTHTHICTGCIGRYYLV